MVNIRRSSLILKLKNFVYSRRVFCRKEYRTNIVLDFSVWTRTLLQRGVRWSIWSKPKPSFLNNNYQRSRAIKCAGGRVVGIRLTQKARISIIYDRFTPLRRNSGATRHYRAVSRKRLLCIYDSRSQGDRLDFITHGIVYLFNTF